MVKIRIRNSLRRKGEQENPKEVTGTLLVRGLPPTLYGPRRGGVDGVGLRFDLLGRTGSRRLSVRWSSKYPSTQTPHQTNRRNNAVPNGLCTY